MAEPFYPSLCAVNLTGGVITLYGYHQFTGEITSSQKSHNASNKSTTMHHAVAEMCTGAFLLQSGALRELCNKLIPLSHTIV